MLRLALLALVACPKPVDPTPTNPWEAVPHLPSPTATVYARSAEAPPDPPVRALIGDRRWDAALSGAAAGLALELTRGQPVALTRWRVREALWRAGYPFPAEDAQAWTAGSDGAPPPPLLAWLSSVSPTDDLGLVRARGHDGDVWVALRAKPPLELGPVPRQVPVGGHLLLPATPGATYVVADANGALQAGELDVPASIPCGSPGEWLVRLSVAGRPVTTLPVYVGLVPPSLPVMTEGPAVRTAEDAMARAESLLAAIREVYGAEPLARDFTLDAGARSLLRGDAGSPEGVKRALGLAPEATAYWDCSGSTVETCLDGVLWDPGNRMALLDDRSGLGLAAAVDANGVRVVGIVSRPAE